MSIKDRGRKMCIRDRWKENVTNEEVLRRVNENRSIIRAIRKKQASCIGHILRRNCLQKLLIEGNKR